MTRLSPLVSCTWCFVVMPRCLKWSNWWGWQMPLGRLTNSHADSTNVLNINVQGIRTTISPLLLRGKTTNSQWCLPCDCCWKRNFCWKCNPWTAKCLCVLTKNPAGCDQTFQNHSNGWHMLGMPTNNDKTVTIGILHVMVCGDATKTKTPTRCDQTFLNHSHGWHLGVLTKNPTRCDQTFQNHSHGCHRLGDAHQQWQDCHHWCLARDGLWWCHAAWNVATGGTGTCSSAD